MPQTVGDYLHNEEEMLEARQRSKEWREAIEEYCPNGGALLGDEFVDGDTRGKTNENPDIYSQGESNRGSEWTAMPRTAPQATRPTLQQTPV